MVLVVGDSGFRAWFVSKLTAASVALSCPAGTALQAVFLEQPEVIVIQVKGLEVIPLMKDLAEEPPRLLAVVEAGQSVNHLITQALLFADQCLLYPFADEVVQVVKALLRDVAQSEDLSRWWTVN